MLSKKTFRIGGIHPCDSKFSRGCAIEELPLPEIFHVSMAQHLGAPATPAVEVGQKVKVGDVLGTPTGFMSAFVHSPASGTVTAIGPRADIAGKMVPHVTIEVEGDEWREDIDRSDTLVTDIPTDRTAVLERIRQCGVVGLGGATFPTHIKLNPAPGCKAECLIINGAECEPFLTSDFRIMLEKPKQIIVGAAIMQSVLGGCRCVLAIEDNKPEAIRVLSKAVAELGFKDMEVQPLKKRYPQGGEKQLIDAVMRRQVKSGALPISEGAVVQNMATSLAVYEAVQKNMPLITNVFTVTGNNLPVEKQYNYKFRIGMPLSFIAKVAGGVPEDTAKIVSGGPMMGKAMSNLDSTITKGTSGLLLMNEDDATRPEAGPCIRCAKCVDACPMGLEPYLLMTYSQRQMWAEDEANHIMDCIECGCCIFSCPANRPILDYVRLGKNTVGKIIRSRKQ